MTQHTIMESNGYEVTRKGADYSIFRTSDNTSTGIIPMSIIKELSGEKDTMDPDYYPNSVWYSIAAQLEFTKAGEDR